MTLGENLRLLRREKGLSQEQVAQTLFVTRQTISKWENDQAEPGIDNLKALAELYGVTLDRLVGAEPTEPSAEPAAASSISLRPPKTRSGPYLFWIALLLIGTGLSALWPLIASTALDAGNNGGTVMSLILFFGYFGAAVIPYVIGLVGDAAGLRVALVASAFVFAALGAVVRFMMPRHISEKRTEV